MKSKFLLVFIIFGIYQTTFSQWMQTGGPNGGYTNEIVQSGSFLILNAGNGGIYRSIDNGVSWKWSNSGLPCNEGVQTLVEHGGILYASISRNGIYISTNAGESWMPINTGIENMTFYSLAVQGNKIYAGNANGGIYYSPDNGANWINKSNGISNIQFQDFIFFNSKIYAGGSSLFESSDNGNTWIKINIGGLGANGVRSLTANNGIFYVADDNTVFTSSNNLVSWNSTIVNTGATIVSMNYIGSAVYLTTSNGRYFFTQNNGISWTLVQNTNTQSFANHLFFSGSKIIMSTSEGLYESIDMGTSWTINNTGISAIQIESLNYNGTFIYAGTDNQGVFRTSNYGQNWEAINTGLYALNSYTVTDIVFIGNDLFLATGGGVYKSINNGDTWTQKFNPGINKSTQVLDYNNNVLATAVNGTGVYISKDLGETWNLVSTNGLNFNTSYDNITIQGNTIIVNTANSETFISQDLGNSWNKISITSSFHLTNELEYINGKLYAATTKGLFISENLGANWELLHNDSKEVYDLIINDDKIYIASSTGVYVTTESDTKWYPLCGGIGRQFSNEILIKDDVIYLGTYSSSVWKRFKVVGELPPKEDEFTIGNEKIVLCSNSSVINLFDSIGISPSTEGEWTPSLSGGNGLFNPEIDAEGSYTFRYSNDICGCESYSKVEVSFDGLSAGADSNIALCLNSNPINLFETLGENADSGGVWSPSLASGTGVFDPQIDSEGVYTYTVTNTGCSNDSSEVQVFVSQELDAGLDGALSICDNELPVNLFNMLGGTPDLGGTWSPPLSSASGIFNPQVDPPGNYTYTVGFMGECVEKVSKVSVDVSYQPNSGEDSEFFICRNSESVDLYDHILGHPDVDGVWSPSLASGTNIFDPHVDSAGIYSYIVQNNCGTSTSLIEVTVHDTFELVDYDVNIIELPNRNSIHVNVNSNLSYEYSLDGLSFQKDSIFNDVTGGEYTVFGREIDGCGFFSEDVFLISYPSYFTPNGDGNNDTWKIKGTISQNYSLFIFDRYGKLLKNLKVNQGWDGTLNGKVLPSSDYWFKAVFDNGITKYGHFALKR